MRYFNLILFTWLIIFLVNISAICNQQNKLLLIDNIIKKNLSNSDSLNIDSLLLLNFRDETKFLNLQNDYNYSIAINNLYFQQLDSNLWVNAITIENLTNQKKYSFLFNSKNILFEIVRGIDFDPNTLINNYLTIKKVINNPDTLKVMKNFVEQEWYTNWIISELKEYKGNNFKIIYDDWFTGTTPHEIRIQLIPSGKKFLFGFSTRNDIWELIRITNQKPHTYPCIYNYEVDE